MGSRFLGYAVIALTIGYGDASPAIDAPAAQTEQTRQISSRFSAGGKAPALVALEIVDAANGRTIVHLLQKPKEIVVVAPKNDP